MNEDKFYRFGKKIYRFRWGVCIFWILLFFCCVPFLTQIMSPFKSTNFFDPNSESHAADTILNNDLGYDYKNLIIMYKSKKPFTKSLLQDVNSSLAPLKHQPIQYEINTPDLNPKQISSNQKNAYVVILFESKQNINPDKLEKFISKIKKPANLKMLIGGEPIFAENTKKQTQIDLYKTEYIATPAAIITMLLVFGSVVAAFIPIVLGGLCAVIILMLLFIAAHTTSLSAYTVNIALLLGLCLSLDYCLFIISRFRDELKKHPASEAIAITQQTAGKAVFFSGLSVFISLSALLFFNISDLLSVSIGGLAAVTVAVAISIILLPAVLSILDYRVNSLAIYKNKPDDQHNKFWRYLVKIVIKYRYFFIIFILAILLLLSYPFLHVKIGISDYRILPHTWESRQVFDIFKKSFGENKLTPNYIIIKNPNGKILTDNNIDRIYEFSRKLKKDYRVDSINSIVDINPSLTKKQYQTLYEKPSNLPPEMRKFLKLTTSDDITVMTIISKFNSSSEETKELIKKIRDTKLKKNLKIQVTGSTANTIDVLHSISKSFIYAFIWVIACTYIILLILLRSVVLPLKATMMTLLSLCASYGILVFVIQDGHFHQYLNFAPQGMIDINLIIIIFCALYGFSMDYEVFLLTRIKEEYEETHENRKSISYGIEHSSKIITSAAIIVIMICVSFMSADILLVKAFGLGIAVAIFVDAFLIRTLLVPSIMAILGKWNWYLPKWLDKILPSNMRH